MGMTDRAIASLTQGNLDTMGKLAFAIGQPGHPLDATEFAAFAQNTLGAMINQADTAVLKRLVFEGHTMVLGQLRELVTDPNAASSRKLPAVEREHRMAELRQRLVGVVLERQLEPSHELLESMMQQKETNQLNFVQIERCTSREWEITMGKNKKQLALDSEKLIIKEKSEIPDQFHSSELQAFEALRRRGVAMTFADMISWEAHERYLQQLTSHLRNEPPPNFMHPTLPQILKADRQVFLFLIRVGVDLRRQPDNSLQLDEKIFTALQSYEVGFSFATPPKGHSKGRGHQASRRTTLRPMEVAKATGQIGGHILTKAKVEVHMEKERTKAGAQCCPNFCWDVTTQTWTCMEGACVSTTRWRSATMHQTEASAHVDGTFAAEKGVMLLMLKKITIRRRSDMPKAASALWWRLVWA